MKPILYGNIARYFGKKRDEDGHTHQWTVYVKPYRNEVRSSCIGTRLGVWCMWSRIEMSRCTVLWHSSKSCICLLVAHIFKCIYIYHGLSISNLLFADNLENQYKCIVIFVGFVLSWGIHLRLSLEVFIVYIMHLLIFQDMSMYVKKVHFKLHESYPNPNRGK